MQEFKNQNVVLNDKEVEGYQVCSSDAAKCKLDCIWPFDAHVFNYNS